MNSHPLTQRRVYFRQVYSRIVCIFLIVDSSSERPHERHYSLSQVDACPVLGRVECSAPPTALPTPRHACNQPGLLHRGLWGALKMMLQRD